MNPDHRQFLAAVECYRRSRRITGILLTFYDQGGRFISNPRVGDCIPFDFFFELAETVLTEDQIIRRHKHGHAILCTSCVWAGNKLPPSLPWHQIDGNLVVKKTASFIAPNLRSIMGTAEIADAEINLPVLEFAGRLRIGDYAEIRLPNLTGAGKFESSAKRLILPRLRKVTGSLIARGADYISAPKLKTVWGHLETYDAAINFDPQIAVGKNWFISSEAEQRWVRSCHLRQVAATTLRSAPDLEV